MLPPVTGNVGVDGLVDVTGVLTDADGDALPLAEALPLGDGLALVVDGEGLGDPYPPGADGLTEPGADGLGEPYPPGVGVQDDRP